MAIQRTCRNNKLSKQPLALVLIQTRFSPISNLDKYIPDIQDELRRTGFPYLTQKTGMRLDVMPEEIKQTSMAQWVFETVDKGTSLILDERQVLLQTVQYDSFELFIKQYLEILDIVMKKTDHSSFGVIERLGLRYVDQIIKQDEKDDIASYLRPELRGMDSSFFKNSSKRYSFATLGDTELRSKRKGKLSIRIIRNNEGMDLPPDLIQDAPRRLRKVEPGLDLALIDMDHGCEGPIGLGVKREGLEELYFGLHDIVIEVLYDSVVTKEGMQKWK
jgi:uncharacterized protein (TIGR04255 family)